MLHTLIHNKENIAVTDQIMQSIVNIQSLAEFDYKVTLTELFKSLDNVTENDISKFIKADFAIFSSLITSN